MYQIKPDKQNFQKLIDNIPASPASLSHQPPDRNNNFPKNSLVPAQTLCSTCLVSNVLMICRSYKDMYYRILIIFVIFMVI